MRLKPPPPQTLEKESHRHPLYISRLAQSFGVFERYPRKHLTLGPATEPYGYPEMITARMVRDVGEETYEWEQVAEVPAEGIRAAPVRRRPVASVRCRPTYPRPESPPRCPPPQQDVTLESLDQRVLACVRMLRAIITHFRIQVPDVAESSRVGAGAGDGDNQTDE